MWSHVAALAVACLAARASADNSTWGARRALRGSQQVVVVPAANAPLRELSDFEPCGVLCKNVEDKGCVDRKLFSPPLVRPDRWMMCVKRCKSPSCPEAVAACSKLKFCTHVVVYGDGKLGAKRPGGGGADRFARLMALATQTSAVAARAGATGGVPRANDARAIAHPMRVTPPPETWAPLKGQHAHAGGKVQVFVFSHRRSGTHLSMSFLQHNFPQAKVVKVCIYMYTRAAAARLFERDGAAPF